MAAAQSSLVSLYFLSLSFVALLVLWGVSVWNGTVGALFAAVIRGHFEDGTPLQTSYTGILVLDFPVSLLVAFFFYGTNGSDPGYQLFLIDAYSTLQSAFVWLYVESAREERKPFTITNPIIWGLLWQALGGAISLPLYFYHHLKWEVERGALAPTGTVSALRSLPFSFAIGAVLPAIIGMLPAWLDRPAAVHQIVLAAWQPDPIWVSAVQSIAVAALNRLYSPRGADRHKESKEAACCTRRAYFYAALSSTAGHVYVLARVISSKDVLVNFWRMYVPHLFTGPARAGQKLANGPWLFLQYDLIIISLSSLSWAYILTKDAAPIYTPRTVLLLVMALGTLLIGPGATVSLCLFWRERTLYKRQRLRKGRKKVPRTDE